MSEDKSRLDTPVQVPPPDSTASTTGETTGDISRDTAAVEHGPLTETGLSAAENALVDVSIRRFQQAVERELAERLDDEEVLARLAQVRRRVNRWSEQTPGQESVEELATRGYELVRLWLRLVVATDQSEVGLAEDDMDEIALETVAHAVNRIPDQPAGIRRETFLAECVDHLPQAYRSWRLKHETLTDEQLESVRSGTFGDALVGDLRRCVTGHQAERLLLSWGHSADEVDETITTTRTALRLPTEPTGR